MAQQIARALSLETIILRNPIDMYTLHDTTSLGSVSLKTLKLQWQPRILLLIVIGWEARTLTDNLPVWEGGDTKLTQCLLLDKTLCVSEQRVSDRHKTWNLG